MPNALRQRAATWVARYRAVRPAIPCRITSRRWSLGRWQMGFYDLTKVRGGLSQVRHRAAHRLTMPHLRCRTQQPNGTHQGLSRRNIYHSNGEIRHVRPGRPALPGDFDAAPSRPGASLGTAAPLQPPSISANARSMSVTLRPASVA
jgi:hypothetical protein